MGRTLQMDVEYTDFDRPRRLASSTHLSFMDTRGALTFDPAPDGTHLRWSWRVEPRGLFRVMSPVVASMGRRQEQRIWTGLKRLLEEQKTPPPQ